MRRKPSEAWYVLAALILFCGMAGAAFGFGSNVRGLFGVTWTSGSRAMLVTFDKKLNAGDPIVLYRSTAHRNPRLPEQCKVIAPTDVAPPNVERLDSASTVSLFGGTFAPTQRITASADASYKFTCANDTWVFGPDVPSWGTRYVLRDWAADFALWFVPGVILSVALAGFIAWRRRSTG